MKAIFISMCLTVAVFLCQAQTGCNVKKAFAFYTVSVPGIQMVDENGNAIPPKADIARFIYIESFGKAKPEIKTVLYNNKNLPATVTAVKEKTVIPGGDLGNNKDFKIIANKSNSLWKIELQQEEDNSMPGQDCKNIIIKTKIKGKTCSFKLLKETELMILQRY